MSIDFLNERIAGVEKGDAHCCWLIGGYYETGNVTIYSNDNLFPKDKAKALWWKIKAAEDGSDYAQYHLGQMYHFGLESGLAKHNMKEAVKWYSRAAENDNFHSLLALAELYLYTYSNKVDIQQDYKKAFEFLSRALEHDFAKKQGINTTQYGLYNAAIKIAELYASGNGVAQDLLLA